MIDAEEWMDIKELHRSGMSQRQIAIETGHSRNTVARVLSETTPGTYASRSRQSCLDAYKDYVKERFEKTGLSACRLCEEIRAQGYTGSADTVERFLRPLKETRKVGGLATVRFETAPGEQAQADWAHVGQDNGQKVYAFLMVLSFSRALFVDFTRSMHTSELIRCHQSAFSYFEGVPARVLFDNQAQVRLPSGQLNPLFADFAAHYGFVPKTHRPYRPRTKGKVERQVDFLKDNFLKGRQFAGFEDLCVQGRHWLENANARLHATTGQRPVDLLQKEREKLLSLTSLRPYLCAERAERKVDTEGFVHLAGARYSVPPEHVGKRVVIVHAEQRVIVRLDGAIVADHAKGAPGACVADARHVADMWRYTLERANTPAKGSYAQFRDAHAVPTPSLCSYDRFCGGEDAL